MITADNHPSGLVPDCERQQAYHDNRDAMSPGRKCIRRDGVVGRRLIHAGRVCMSLRREPELRVI